MCVILRFIGLICSCLVLFNTPVFAFGGGFHRDSPPSNAKSLPPFYKLVCTDNMTLRLTGRERASSLAVTHKPENTQLISNVVDDILYLSTAKQNPKKPIGLEAMRVSLKTGPIKSIMVSGNCQIVSTHLQTYGIELIAQDTGQITLTGNLVKVASITAEGNSRIKVLWVSSPRLYLNAYGTSHVKIAGIANEILLKAYDASLVDAQYLRTCFVNVSTKQAGFAEVFPLYGMRAFAEDRGRVDYYTVPNNAIAVTQCSGNVLWMGYRN